ncbi:sigma-54-dependent transcriptional regulator [Sphingomonas sp. J315]|uniref:sigma-54-dependent transcriptional regulator n=2 Tax=unclassified Sphingomonas TaxID=196159 RepID=UPI0021ADEE06|nr:sigma 54-interacting transcriptional regulator [Sphingomonas sp. J315]UUX98923.1 sigma 54-interacting transcriptional regulator [Sphingomonas sp. J315]
MQLRLMIVGASSGPFGEAARMAQSLGAEVMIAETATEALVHLRETGAGLVMIDVDSDVPSFMRALIVERFAVPVLACGIDAPAERAVAAIRAGARDYIPLPPDRELIAAAIAQMAQADFAPMVGEDPSWLRALEFARAMAPAHAPILISGERGTGKERVAHATHAASGRSGFITVECNGVAADVLESELFGHAAGAFEGALAGRRGAFSTATGGTLFIRDIDRLPAPLQLRVLKTMTAPGAPNVIASTRRDLAALVDAGQFRSDLLARFALATVALPPLRARGGDIRLLAATFAARFAAMQCLPSPLIDPATETLLTSYEWPGNVAELQDAMHRAVLLSPDGYIGPEAIVLADGSRLAPPASAAGKPLIASFVGQTVEEVERQLILETLERCQGNRTSASQILGISVRTMRNKLKAFVEAGIAVVPAT